MTSSVTVAFATMLPIADVVMSKTESPAETTLPVKVDTREKILRPLKRGGETYDQLLRKMAAQYTPEDPEVDL